MSQTDQRPRAAWSLPPRIVRRIVGALCALAVVLDLLIHRHEQFAFAGTFGFYAVFSLIGGVVLVIVANGLRRLVMRGEAYYDGEDG